MDDPKRSHTTSATIRAVYTLDVHPGYEAALHQAWADIVDAHMAQGHGALESMMLRDPERPGRWLAISRWASRHAWEEHQGEEAAPEAYEAFGAACEVVERCVYEEVDLKRARTSPHRHATSP